ncbi:MAG: ABC transporter ATP-binding protein [Firmicutes bacterium]|nr:ABC transporter ATP-binding protein [Bacillota bacterium]
MARRLVWDFVREHGWLYLVVIVTIGLSRLIQVQIPNLIGAFINQLEHHGTMASVRFYAGRLAVVSVGFVVLFGVGQYLVNRLARVFEGDLRRRLFEHWETLEPHYFHRHTVGDLLSHVLNDIPQVRQAMGGGMSQILQAVFLFAATLYMAVRHVNLVLTIIAVVPLLGIPLVVTNMGPKMRGQSRRVQESLSEMSDLAEESLASIRLIKSTANEEIEGERFRARVDAAYEEAMQQVRLNTLFQSLIPLLTGISFALTLSYGGDLALTHRISLGAFVAFTVYLSMLVRPLMQFGNVINIMQNSSASLIRIETLLKAKPAIQDPENPRPMPRRPTIEFRHLTYRYPDAQEPVLYDINLTIPFGTTIGIVGRTGSGKSTLVSLLLREIDPPPGTLFFDGVDIRDIHRRDLRARISYVPQDGFLFSSSVGYNIGFPRERVEPEELVQAARQAQILSTIEEFPDQFETVVGERGVNLSGGQRQRVAMARALIKTKAEIVIFDDSLSAVDSRTETAILQSLGDLKRQGRTVIIISHRLSSLRHADWVAVLEKGRLTQSGTPKDLIRQPGLYRHLYQMQAEGRAPDGS